jgi:hypothetical protein
VWPDGYIYIWWDLPKELIKVEFGNDIKRMAVTLLVISTVILDIIWVSQRQKTSQTAIRSDVMQDVICSNFVSSSFVKKDTREFVIGIETACASWLGVTVACRQPPSASSWATFCKGRMRLEWRLCCTASSAAAEVDFIRPLFKTFGGKLEGRQLSFKVY